jgi:hypothetical protein
MAELTQLEPKETTRAYLADQSFSLGDCSSILSFLLQLLWSFLDIARAAAHASRALAPPLVVAQGFRPHAECPCLRTRIYILFIQNIYTFP